MANEADHKRALDVFVVLSKAYKAMAEHAERDIRNYGLNPTEFAVLELLFHKGPQALQQIGSKILLASGSITYVVDKLEKHGYLHRQACTEDRRVTYAIISKKGEELLSRIFPSHAEAIFKAAAGLEPFEQEQIHRLLKKLGVHARELLQ